MKSFLIKDKTDTSKAYPIIKWGMLPDDIFFEGKIPEGHSLAVCPHQPYIIVDIDRHEGSVNGFNNIPEHLKAEIEQTFWYATKNNGKHCWFYYTGNKTLMNKASKYGIDLRIGATYDTKGNSINNGGYVKWHPRDSMDIRTKIFEINGTSKEMNIWLEKLFS